MNLRLAFYSRAVCIGLVLQASTLTYADSGQADPRRGPPQAAIDACASLSAGDTCSFTGREDTDVTGTCFAPPGRDLACRPDNFRAPPVGRQQGETEQAMPQGQ